MKFDFNKYLSAIVAESDVCIVHDQIKANILHDDEDDDFSYFDFENKMEEKNKTIADKMFESYEDISRKSNIIKVLDELKGPKIEAIKDCLKKEIKEENDKIKQLVNDLLMLECMNIKSNKCEMAIRTHFPPKNMIGGKHKKKDIDWNKLDLHNVNDYDTFGKLKSKNVD